MNSIFVCHHILLVFSITRLTFFWALGTLYFNVCMYIYLMKNFKTFSLSLQRCDQRTVAYILTIHIYNNSNQIHVHRFTSSTSINMFYFQRVRTHFKLFKGRHTWHRLHLSSIVSSLICFDRIQSLKIFIYYLPLTNACRS